MSVDVKCKARPQFCCLSAKRQLEFNQLMLAFYESGDETDMQVFMLSCLDSRMVDIMN